MTILIMDVITQYTGTGTRKLFEYGFEVFEDTHVFVTVNGYPVDVVEQDNGVVIDPAPALGAIILIYRETDVTQLADFQPFESFPAEKTEDAVDKLIYLKQEAFIWRAQLNLFADPYVDRVVLVNDKGTDADLFLWNIDKAGMFSGEVTTQMPLPGTFVEKPWDFAYFQYGEGITTYDLILTSTLYPIEADEHLEVTPGIEAVYKRPVPEDEIDIGWSVAGAGMLDTLLQMPNKVDEVDVNWSVTSANMIPVLLTMPDKEDEVDVNWSVTDADMKFALVAANADDHAITMTPAVESITMTSV